MFLKRLLFSVAATTLVKGSVGTEDIFGLRKQIYVPRCAHACRITIRGSSLDCTLKSKTSPECFASNEPYLESLAFCISSHCKDISIQNLDKFWNQYVVGWQESTPAPILSYERALESAREPESTLRYGKLLDVVSLVAPKDYLLAYASLADWNEAESYHTRFTLLLFLSGFLVPITLSLLRFIPFPKGLSSRYRSYFIYPLVWRAHWNVFIRDIGDISPTWGQALFIVYMFVINAILSATGHFALSYHYWSFDGRHGQFITCLANRFGALSMANLPLLFLYSGRNNVLLRITNWSRATFLMLHRWLAYITLVEALLHSVFYLHVAAQQGKHSEWFTMQAWYSGSIASIAIALILPLSLIAIRRSHYEVFLFVHILLSVVVLVGTFYHLYKLFNTRWSGYILYLWFAISFWLLDRIARIVRLARSGVKTAIVTVIDEDYVRLDIPNTKGIGHAYLYFPTLTWRFWENHPFSIASTPAQNMSYTKPLPSPMFINLQSPSSSFHSKGSSNHSESAYSPVFELKSVQSFSTTSNTDAKSPSSPFRPQSPTSPTTAYIPFSQIRTQSTTSLQTPTSTTNLIYPSFPTSSKTKSETLPSQGSQSLTFFMRTHAGTTAKLRLRSSLPVLIEASYAPNKNLDAYPVLICIAGGVGITAILPYLHAHAGITKLYWGSRSAGLVNALREEVRGYRGEIVVGKRLDVRRALEREFAGLCGSVDVGVVVSGPKGMGDVVREFVCEVAMGRSGDVRLLDENFGW